MPTDPKTMTTDDLATWCEDLADEAELDREAYPEHWSATVREAAARLRAGAGSEDTRLLDALEKSETWIEFHGCEAANHEYAHGGSLRASLRKLADAQNTGT